jgi:hypothetical protein
VRCHFCGANFRDWVESGLVLRLKSLDVETEKGEPRRAGGIDAMTAKG